MAERRLTLSPDDAARVRSIEALVGMGAGAVPDLVARLTDPSWAVRRSVVAGLAQLGTVAVAPLLRLVREQRDDENRLAAAVDALAASRGDVDDAVMALAGEPVDPHVVCDAAQILGRRKVARAIPLLAGLTRHADDNVAVAAVEALGRIGGDAGVEALIELAGSGSFFRVFPTIDVLGRSGDARAVPALLGLLDNRLFTAEAARALGRTGDERAVPALARLLGGSSPAAHVRVAAQALVELQGRQRERYGVVDEVPAALAPSAPPRAAHQLLAALAGSEPAERAAIAQVLGWLGGDEAIAGLFGLLADERGVAQVASAGLVGLRAAIDEQLASELRSSDSSRRLALLPLVGGRARHLDDLLDCLRDSDAAVRAATCEAIARTGDARAVPRLFLLLGDPDPRVVQAAMGGIQSLGSGETERLALEAARAREPGVRRAAYRIIGYFGYQGGLEALLAGADEPDPRLKETAIAGLALIEDERALAALLGARHDPSARTRAAAVRALGQAEPSAAGQKALREAARDDDGWVRYYACQALGRQRDEASTELLVAMLADPAGQVRVAAVEALARLRHPDALAALTEALRSPDADVRRAALVGLGQSRRDEALATLLETLTDPDPSTRLVVISALAMFDAPEVTRALARAGGDPDESVRSAAVELLSARAGALATQLLAELIDQPALRERIGRSLTTPAEGRVDGLVAALEHSDGERALLLAGILARLRRPDAEAALALVVRTGATPARRAAAEALRLVRSTLAREALEAASANDPDAGVRRIAALALEG